MLGSVNITTHRFPMTGLSSDEFISQNFNFRVIIADPSVRENRGEASHLDCYGGCSEL